MLNLWDMSIQIDELPSENLQTRVKIQVFDIIKFVNEGSKVTVFVNE